VTARYRRHGMDFATYNLSGEGVNAEALRLMAWRTAELGWEWVIE
jgi:hypothetical protein